MDSAATRETVPQGRLKAEALSYQPASLLALNAKAEALAYLEAEAKT